MGRCSFNYRPRFYTFLPVFNEVNAALDVSYKSLGHWSPLSGSPDSLPDVGRANIFEQGKNVLGCMVSAERAINTNDTLRVTGMNQTGSGEGRNTNAPSQLKPPQSATTVDFTGRISHQLITNEVDIQGGASGGEGYFRIDGFALDNSNFGLLGFADNATDGWEGLGGVYVGSFHKWGNYEDSTMLDPNLTGGTTHDIGPVAGGLTIFPFPSTRIVAASGTIRKIEAPMDMRVLGVTFSHFGKNGGTPTMQLLNDTTGVAITNAEVLDSTGNVSLEVLPNGANDFPSNGAARDITRGDVLSLECGGIGTDIDGPQCYLIVAVRGHFNVDPRRDVGPNNPGAVARNAPNARSWSVQRSVSGPATGGIAFWPFGEMNLADNQDDTLLSSLPAPFDCTVLAAVFANQELTDAVASGTKIDVRNATQGVTIADDMNPYYYYAYDANASGFAVADWNGSYGFTTIGTDNRNINRGDNIQVWVDTPATEAALGMQGGLYVHVTGFPAHGPELD